MLMPSLTQRDCRPLNTFLAMTYETSCSDGCLGNSARGRANAAKCLIAACCRFLLRIGARALDYRTRRLRFLDLALSRRATMVRMSVVDPHAGRPCSAGAPTLRQRASRSSFFTAAGASAANILGLAREFQVHDVAYVAPQAARSTWYPYSFLAPMSENEPGLGSALKVIDGLVSRLERQQVPPGHIAMIGFSQGACLALEFAARHPRRYDAGRVRPERRIDSRSAG